MVLCAELLDHVGVRSEAAGCLDQGCIVDDGWEPVLFCLALSEQSIKTSKLVRRLACSSVAAYSFCVWALDVKPHVRWCP